MPNVPSSGRGAAAWVGRWFRVLTSLLVMASMAGMAVPAHAQLAPGDILVADFEGGEDGAGLLFFVNRATGDRAVLSDFGNPGQGPTGQSPYGVAVVDADTVLVVDNQGVGGSGTLFIVDGATGVRTILSDFSDPAQGPLGVEPVGVALGSAGILVTDIEAGTGGAGALFRVHPLTGVRTLLSDFGNAAQGPLGKTPTGVARGPNGIILVIDPDAGTDVPSDGKEGGNGALFIVDPVTGTRTLLSDFGNVAKGPTGVNPVGVAIVPLIRGGDALVIDFVAETGALFSVDLATGARTLLSNFGDPRQGPVAGDPFDVAVGTGGDILVVEEDFGGHGALFRIDPISGARPLLSNFANNGQGPVVTTPHGVALGPDGDILVATANGGTGGRGTLVRVNPVTGVRTLVSDFGDATQGFLGADPEAVAPLDAGHVLVVDLDAPGSGNNSGRLFRVNLATGACILVSDFSDIAQGMLGSDPADVEVEANGSVVVVEASLPTAGGAQGTLFRIDPLTGNRTVPSNFTDATKGPTGRHPFGVALEPGGGILVLDNGAGTDGRGALFRVNPSTGIRTVVSDFGDAGQGPLGVEPVGVTMYPENGQAAEGHRVVRAVPGHRAVRPPGDRDREGEGGRPSLQPGRRRRQRHGGSRRAPAGMGSQGGAGHAQVRQARRDRRGDRVRLADAQPQEPRRAAGARGQEPVGTDQPARPRRLGPLPLLRRQGHVRARPGAERPHHRPVRPADHVPGARSQTALHPDQQGRRGPGEPDGRPALLQGQAGEGQPKHVPVAGITAHDEFGISPLQSVKAKQLCVPAETTGGP